ncbi:MAG: lactonase family protein [Clostridia bacterium]|nr:lactonase family protein [Clostridia bacterium]
MKFFVGDYTRIGGPGVSLCELEGNIMRLLESVPNLKNPTYQILSADQKTLYSTANDENGGSAAAFDVSSGHLRLVSRQSTAGGSACHLTLSPDERFLYVANYITGNLAVFPVCGAEIGERIQLIQHEGHGPREDRQECAHVHFVAFDPDDDQLLYAVDLGIDAVMAYRQNPETGLLTAQERIDFPAGIGPRHLIFRGADLMYVAHELGSAVSALKRTSAGWKIIQTLSTLPEDWSGENTVAAIRIMDNLLFVSNRGHDSLAVYEISRAGSLTLQGIYSTMGRTPRDFFILPDGRILAAHQDSGDVRLLAFDHNGLAQIGEPLPLAGAVCICPIIE